MTENLDSIKYYFYEAFPAESLFYISREITKSDSARLALKGIRRISRVAFFATAADMAYDPKSWAAGVWTLEKRKLPLSSD
ncbi:hypothetical protein D2910_16340 [Planomicrobium okeanokoites]|nr:hypothetical protein D2910_16340 [Planomicrobium okeanokoites]